MGWASGGAILEEIWREIRGFLPEDKRVSVFAKLADVMWENDCDTLDYMISDDWPEVEPALIEIGYLDKDWRKEF